MRGWQGLGVAAALGAVALLGSIGCTGARAGVVAGCGPMQVEAEEGGCRALQASGVRSEEVTFSSQETPGGRVQLLGTLTRPQWEGDDEGPEQVPGVVVIGGSGPHSRRGLVPGDLTGPYAAPVPVLEDLALGLTQAGYAVLRYDKRSCTAAVVPECTYSPEVAQATTWEDLRGDVIAAARFLASQPGVDPRRIILVGHSQGATLALEAAPQVDGLERLVLLAGTYYPIDAVIARQVNWQLDAFRASMTAEQQREAEEKLAAIESGLLAIREGYMPEEELFLGARPSFWRAWMEASAGTEARLRGLSTPILYLRGGEDQNAAAVDGDAFGALLKGRAGSAAQLLPGHNHALGRVGAAPHVSDAAMEAMVRWLGEAASP